MIVLTCTLVPAPGRADECRDACRARTRETAGGGAPRLLWNQDESTGALHLVETHDDATSVLTHGVLTDPRLASAGTFGDARLFGDVDARSDQLHALIAGARGAAELGAATGGRLRRVVVGLDDEGRSTVLADAHDIGVSLRPSGALVQDVWRVEQIPVHPAADGATHGELPTLKAPAQGALLRLFTLPPDSDRGRYGADVSEFTGPTLGKVHTISVGVVVSGRGYAMLDTGDVLLSQGDTIIVASYNHSWRNPFDRDFVVAFLTAPALREA